MHLLGAALHQQARRLHQRAGGIGNIVDDDAALAGDIADHRHVGNFAGLFAALVDDSERCVDPLGQFARPGHAADIGADHHHLFKAIAEMMLDIEGEDRAGIKVIHRHIEKALDLGGVQIHRQHPLDSGLGDHVGHQLGADRGAGPGAAVLPCVAEIGDHGGDPRRRRAAQRIGDDQQLHQVVVRRVRGRLDDEHVFAAHVFVDLDENLLVVEPFDAGADEVDLGAAMDRHSPRHRGRQGQVGIARNELGFVDSWHMGVPGVVVWRGRIAAARR